MKPKQRPIAATIRRHAVISFLFILLLQSATSAFAEKREILSSISLSPKLQEIISGIQNPEHPKVPYSELTAETEYFVRIAPRRHVVTEDNKIQDDAVLGTKPFVFFTTPQGIYGKNLLEIYLDIGYEAEDIIRWQQGQDMVAIVFRYPGEITFSDVRNGHLPEKWDQKVYAPT